jgi:hypothetical protein
MSKAVTLLSLGIVLFAEPAFCAQADQQRTISVCDLLSHVDGYRDKEVHVRGELREGPEEFALYGDNCRGGLITNGHAWPVAVWITPPDGTPAGRVDFSMDEKAVQALKTKLQSERAAGRRGKVLVTLVGKVEVRKKLFGGPNATGNWIGNGFGHLNAYPGQLVIRTVENVEIFE